MPERRPQDLALIIGLSIPVLMIVFVGGVVFLSRACSSAAPPRHDFVYSVGYPKDDARYAVRQGRLVIEAAEGPRHYASPGLPAIQLFLHDVAANSSRLIEYSEAADLRLDSTALSPDGYSIVPGRNAEFFFPMFPRTDYRTRYLRKDGSTLKLTLEVGENRGLAYSFGFVGWVLED